MMLNEMCEILKMENSTEEKGSPSRGGPDQSLTGKVGAAVAKQVVGTAGNVSRRKAKYR